jgi:hypothetical protein
MLRIYGSAAPKRLDPDHPGTGVAGSPMGTLYPLRRFLGVGWRSSRGIMSIPFERSVRANYPSERPACDGVDYAVAAIWVVGVIGPWLLLLHRWL